MCWIQLTNVPIHAKQLHIIYFQLLQRIMEKVISHGNIKDTINVKGSTS
jgi:hypothetical protein